MLSVQCLFSGTNFNVQLIQLSNTSDSVFKRLSKYDYMYFHENYVYGQPSWTSS